MFLNFLIYEFGHIVECVDWRREECPSHFQLQLYQLPNRMCFSFWTRWNARIARKRDTNTQESELRTRREKSSTPAIYYGAKCPASSAYTPTYYTNIVVSILLSRSLLKQLWKTNSGQKKKKNTFLQHKIQFWTCFHRHDSYLCTNYYRRDCVRPLALTRQLSHEFSITENNHETKNIECFSL